MKRLNSLQVLSLVAAIAGASISTPAAFAGGNGGRLIDKRQQHQVQRIKHGVKSGALSGRETGRLIADQARTRLKEKRFKADGNLSGKERARLHRELNRSGRRIYRNKHDAQSR